MNKLSLRMPADQVRTVKALAKAKGVSVSELLRMAATEYVDAARHDREMQRRRRRTMEHDWEVFDLGG